MKKYGMLMTPANAQKCHDGTKMVTRRVIVPQPPEWWDTCHWDDPDAYYKPRYRPGMIVAIKETHWRWGYKERNEKGNWRFVPDMLEPATQEIPEVVFAKPGDKPKTPEVVGYHGISGLFLPFDLARTHWEILSVRPERLQEITRDDASLEGVDWKQCPTYDTPKQLAYNISGKNVYTSHTIDYIGGFRKLWDSINPKHPWDSNPWVWRYEGNAVNPSPIANCQTPIASD